MFKKPDEDVIIEKTEVPEKTGSIEAEKLEEVEAVEPIKVKSLDEIIDESINEAKKDEKSASDLKKKTKKIDKDDDHLQVAELKEMNTKILKECMEIVKIGENKYGKNETCKKLCSNWV